MNHDDLDGSDSKISAAHPTLNSNPVRQDDVLKGYVACGPWEPAYYSRFDDLKPGKGCLYDPCVEGVLGLKVWTVPVVGVEKMLDIAHNSYEQVKMGMLEICEYPNGDGTSDMVLSISSPKWGLEDPAEGA